ncbi:MAG: DUF4410 domain-containing protein [Bryobacteraceae bacterium]|jgi:hypothetical protein
MKYFHCALTLAIGGALLNYAAWAQTPGTGHVQIKVIQSYSGASSLNKPTAIVVYKFAATQEEVELNKSAFNRVRMRVSGAKEDEKTKLAHKIVDDFSQSLIKDLQKTGLSVSQGVAGELPPDNSLAVQGDFLVIDEGNRTRRMAIGLGTGASKVVTHVECYLKMPDKNLMLSEFKATSKSSRKPGAAETMGVGAAPEAAAAVSGATEVRQGAEGDTERMAKAVAKEITKALKSQGWVQESQ